MGLVLAEILLRGPSERLYPIQPNRALHPKHNTSRIGEQIRYGRMSCRQEELAELEPCAEYRSTKNEALEAAV
jgi:hypothetical protein